MALTGVSPTDPIPSTRRELIFGAGLSSGGADRKVLLYGNRTAAGIEPTNTLGNAIVDDSDAQLRFGLRSELYSMYRAYVNVDSGATINAIAVPEGTGQASVDLTVTNVPTSTSTLEITITGVITYLTVESGTAVNDIAANIAAAINNGDDGRYQCTASAAMNVVTVDAAQLGPRGDYVLGDTATRGLRVRFLQPVNTTVVKAALVAGGAKDDFTLAYAQAELSEIYYQISADSTNGGGADTIGPTYVLSATDSGLGEGLDMIRQQALPINGKSQVMCMGLVGPQSDASGVATNAVANTVRGFFFHQEHSDWTPAMLAAQHGAVVRSQQIAQPSANFAGYTSTDATVYQVPAPFVNADRPSVTEIRADLENGVCPIATYPTGRTYLVRFITSRSENSTGAKDYRARPGHVTSAIDFAWEVVKARWESTKQGFVADRLKEGQKPLLNTTTPTQIEGLINGVIDDLTSTKPLSLYDGPILAPDLIDAMKKSLIVTKVPAGISASVDFVAVQHLYKGEFTIREVGEAY